MKTTLEKSTEAPELKPYLLPCRIDASGSAPVSSYFLEQPAQIQSRREGGETQECWEASLRGRRLLGQDLPVPEGYQGHIYTQDTVYQRGQENEETGRRWRGTGQWSSMRIWGQDHPIDLELDPMARTLRTWTRLADVLSKDPPTDWIESSSPSMKGE
ncbi:ribonuclease H2 non-catalytic subunit-domain-containing protein [Piptocephalis cylindrospora]|uniref:Ribonuclease H2 non-catalytic subunit-domain-containing protein n=1 Tax=Piptocephalis cylindrospora TaxID=1907219 RepID=A0A4P9Y7P8_9FUNG|nr:ribonuclease H2 non-catalytic subunit-domain-containing protein [Piptocephalis cylindrospora]|eukprot:RKP15035.1 ribonuclease H2 non-catalytic subunit-domain-containing protein [Piptocephalis cylindrospora]